MKQPRSGRAAEERVFSAVLDAIQDQRLAPGTRLGERELSELLGASRGAVRAALARLGHSLLVELRPNRGAVIANPGAAQTRDVFDARCIVESALVERLARGLDAGQLAQLVAYVNDEQRAYERGDRKAGQRLSIRFHKLLSELAGNGELDRFLGQLICRTPLLALARNGRGLVYCGVDEHRAIVEALAARDPALAAERMRAHLAAVEGALRVEGPTASSDLAAALHARSGAGVAV
jgi:DNA-binding GntR family transcriptional regulator